MNNKLKPIKQRLITFETEGINQESLPVGGSWIHLERKKMIGNLIAGDYIEVDVYKNRYQKSKNNIEYTYGAVVTGSCERNPNPDVVHNNRYGNFEYKRIY
jgi:hypothetical protein